MLETNNISGNFPPIRARLGRTCGFHCCITTRTFVSPAAYNAEATARGAPVTRLLSTNTNGHRRVR